MSSETKTKTSSTTLQRVVTVVVPCGLPGAGKSYYATILKKMCEEDKNATIWDAFQRAAYCADMVQWGEAAATASDEGQPRPDEPKLPAYDTADEKTKSLRKAAPGRVQIVSANNFFMKAGRFVYNSRDVGLAHTAAQNEFHAAFTDPAVEIIVIDNCNMRVQDLREYIQPILSKGILFTLDVVLAPTSWCWNVDECHRRGIHAVPKEAIKRMLDYFDPNIKTLDAAAAIKLWGTSERMGGGSGGRGGGQSRGGRGGQIRGGGGGQSRGGRGGQSRGGRGGGSSSSSSTHRRPGEGRHF